MTLPTHFTAWLVNDRSALDGDFMDITILEDELRGEDPEDEGAWSSTSNQVFYATTSVRVDDGDIDDARAEARKLIEDASWEIAGDWDITDNAYIVTVERR